MGTLATKAMLNHEGHEALPQRGTKKHKKFLTKATARLQIFVTLCAFLRRRL
jgi:hypothetical protein